MTTITDVADGYLAALAAIDANAADVAGRQSASRFGDLSPDGYAARADLDRRTLTAVRAATAHTTAERALRAALLDRLNSDLALHDCGFTTRLLAPLHLDVPLPAGNGITDVTRWSPEFAAAFLSAVAGIDPETARFEINRYLGWPGQALAFKAGARLWTQARREAERRAGASFDRKRFHADALRLGPMCLDPLRAVLLSGRERP